MINTNYLDFVTRHDMSRKIANLLICFQVFVSAVYREYLLFNK